MERLKRLREPAAAIALVALGVHLVVLLLSALLSRSDWAQVAPHLASALADPVLLLLLTVLVVACWVAEPTPHARGLTVAALALTAATLTGVAAFGVAAVVLAPAGVWSTFLLGATPPLAAGVIALGTLIGLLRRPQSRPLPPPELEPAEPEPEPVDPQQQPEWTPDTAVGTVWRRAGDAAVQRPATSWDAPGASGGWWDPDSSADIPTEPTRRGED